MTPATTTSSVPTLPPEETTSAAIVETTTVELTTSTPDGGGHIVSRPSTVPYCPIHFVDCGLCRCVPPTSCGYCPGAWSPSPLPEPVDGESPRPSVVPGCPLFHVDCGTCLLLSCPIEAFCGQIKALYVSLRGTAPVTFHGAIVIVNQQRS